MWVQVAEPFADTTAAQLASDLRNAHERDLLKMRIRGVLQGERWETASGRLEADPDRTHYYLWFRLISSS